MNTPSAPFLYRVQTTLWYKWYKLRAITSVFAAGLSGRSASPSWQVGVNAPYLLQFAGFIAQQARFDPASQSRPLSQVEREWHHWWDTLLTSDALPALGYDPPAFVSLTDAPRLQQLCQRQWPAFENAWKSPQQEEPFGEKVRTQLNRRVDLYHLVADATRAAGLVKTPPFLLRVQFVRWPEDTYLSLADGHLLFGAHYLEPSQAETLRSILRTRIVNLIEEITQEQKGS